MKATWFCAYSGQQELLLLLFWKEKLKQGRNWWYKSLCSVLLHGGCHSNSCYQISRRTCAHFCGHCWKTLTPEGSNSHALSHMHVSIFWIIKKINFIFFLFWRITLGSCSCSNWQYLLWQKASNGKDWKTTVCSGFCLLLLLQSKQHKWISWEIKWSVIWRRELLLHWNRNHPSRYNNFSGVVTLQNDPETFPVPLLGDIFSSWTKRCNKIK